VTCGRYSPTDRARAGPVCSGFLYGDVQRRSAIRGDRDASPELVFLTRLPTADQMTAPGAGGRSHVQHRRSYLTKQSRQGKVRATTTNRPGLNHGDRTDCEGGGKCAHCAAPVVMYSSRQGPGGDWLRPRTCRPGSSRADIARIATDCSIPAPPVKPACSSTGAVAPCAKDADSAFSLSFMAGKHARLGVGRHRRILPENR